MDSSTLDFLDNKLAVLLISAIFGSLLTALVTKLHNKTSVFLYSTNVERIGQSSNNPIFGQVNITWQNNAVRNLYLATVRVENTTTRDFENVTLKVYTGQDTILLNEGTSIVGTPYIIQWSAPFAQQMNVPVGQVPTQIQLDIYNHSREYTVLVFNRAQKLEFTYLCTKPSADDFPGIFVSTLFRGARLKYQSQTSHVLGVPVQVALARGAIITILVVLACGYYVSSVWIAIAIATSVGLFAQIFGAIVYKTERQLRHLISG